MSREGRRRAEEGDSYAKRLRDRMQEMAARPEDRQGGDPKRPLHVDVVSGQKVFFERMAEALGLTMQGGSGQKGFSAVTYHFAAMVSEQKAITQASKQFVDEMRVANERLRELHTVIGDLGRSGRAPRGSVPRGYGDHTTQGSLLAHDLDNPDGPLVQHDPHQTSDGGQRPGEGKKIPRDPQNEVHQHLQEHYRRSSNARPDPHYRFGRSGGHVDRQHRPTLSTLRARAADAVHQRYGLGGESVLHTTRDHDDFGNWFDRHTEERPDGTIKDVTLTDRVGQLAGRNLAGKSMVSRAAGAVGEGGVMAGLRAVPYVGAALMAGEVVNKGASWLTNQRAANARYQSVFDQGNSSLGGLFGQGNTGLSNRMQEAGFVLSNRFSLSGLDQQDAQKLFQGVSGLGWSGQQRNTALQLGQQAYATSGVPVDQTMQAFSVSAGNANDDLQNLVKSLEQVSAAAAKTGVNANIARESFIATYQSLSTVMGGQAPQSLANSFTMANAGTSRLLAGVSEAGMLTNPAMAALVAQSSGYSSMNQMYYAADKGDTARVNAGVGKVQANMIPQVVGAQAVQAIQAYAQSHGGDKAVVQSQGMLEGAGMEGMRVSQLPPQSLIQILQGMGITGITGAPQAWSKVAEIVLQGQPGGVNGPGAQGNDKTSALTSQQQGALGDTTISSGGGKAAGERAPMRSATPSTDNVLAANPGLKGFYNGLSGGAKDQAGKDISAYGSFEKKFNTNDPTLQALVTKLGSDPNVGIKVTTAAGPQVVSLDSALTNFPDQLAEGTAEVVGGQYDGKTLKDLNGTDTGYKAGQYGNSLRAAGGTGGATSQGDWTKQHPDAAPKSDTASSGNKVTLDLTPAAQQLVTQYLGGSPSGANAQGGVPATPSGVNGQLW